MHCILGMQKLTDTMETYLIHTLNQWCSRKKIVPQISMIVQIYLFPSHLQVLYDHSRCAIPHHFIRVVQHWTVQFKDYFTERKYLGNHFPVIDTPQVLGIYPTDGALE